MMKDFLKKSIGVMVLTIMAVGLVGCSNTEELSNNTFLDRSGTEIIIPENVDTIVSMAPSITETLVHMGLSDKIIAYDKYSAEVEGVPEGLPVFDIMAPDVETLAMLKPDIMFTSGMSSSKGDDPFKSIKDLGILVTSIPSSYSFEGIKEDIIFIGKMTKSEKVAEDIVKNFDKEVIAIQEKIEAVKSDKKVYFEIAPGPEATSFGSETFLNEMITLLGGKNVLADQSGWVKVSEEQVLSLNPDIIFTNVNSIENPVQEILNRNSWSVISAVKDKRVYQVDKNTSSRPNEFVVNALKEMAKAMYPEVF